MVLLDRVRPELQQYPALPADHEHQDHQVYQVTRADPAPLVCLCRQVSPFHPWDPASPLVLRVPVVHVHRVILVVLQNTRQRSLQLDSEFFLDNFILVPHVSIKLFYP